MVALLGALALCGPWIGFWTLPPAAGTLACFVLADHLGRRTRFPEYAMLAAWIASQLAIGAGVALSGGPESPALVLMVVPIVSLSARFGIRGVGVGVAATLAIMGCATAAADPSALVADPSLTILAAASVLSVGALSTALMRSDVQHRSEAVLDPLTGMLNRNALETRAVELEHLSALAGQPVGLIVADIDHFKRVNDRYGHTTGDLVLTGVAERLREELRAFDLAYRIGGEEFLLLLPGADVDRATELAEQLHRRVAAAEIVEGIEITMSFGISGSPVGRRFDYEQAFAEADQALLAAKRAGRNRVRRFADHARPYGEAVGSAA